jgi:hypothetical protein
VAVQTAPTFLDPIATSLGSSAARIARCSLSGALVLDRGGMDIYGDCYG